MLLLTHQSPESLIRSEALQLQAPLDFLPKITNRLVLQLQALAEFGSVKTLLRQSIAIQTVEHAHHEPRNQIKSDNQ